MIARQKQQEILDVAEGLLDGDFAAARSLAPTDRSAMIHAMRRISEPLSDEKDGAPGNTEADRQLMYEVLVYRINKYRSPDHKIHLKEM